MLHDRNPVAVKLSDGSIRNAYTVRLLNKRGFDRVIAIDVDGPVNATDPCRRRQFGDAGPADDRDRRATRPRELRVLVTAPADSNPEKSVPVQFRVTDIGLGETCHRHRQFRRALKRGRSIAMQADPGRRGR